MLPLKTYKDSHVRTVIFTSVRPKRTYGMYKMNTQSTKRKFTFKRSKTSRGIVITELSNETVRLFHEESPNASFFFAKLTLPVP